MQRVLRDEHNQLIDIVRLARCYGREYEPAVPIPGSAIPGTIPVTQTCLTTAGGTPMSLPSTQPNNQRTR